MHMCTPIVIFAFNRPDSLVRLIESLKANVGYEHHDIFIFVDGPRNDEDQTKVDKVLEIAHRLTTNVTASPVNKGLGPSIIDGVNLIINKYGKAIVLEDDLVLMPGFLTYVEKALDMYEADSRIFAICGYGLKIKRPKNYSPDVYLSNRASSWGWGTWADRWNSVDWNVSDWNQLKSSTDLQKAFNRGGSDMFGMLKNFMEGKNRSWAIRFCYSQHKQGKYSIHPFRSFVSNEGYGTNATNCKQKFSRFQVDLDTSTASSISLTDHLDFNPTIAKRLYRYHSLPMRIYSLIRKILNV